MPFLKELSISLFNWLLYFVYFWICLGLFCLPWIIWVIYDFVVIFVLTLAQRCFSTTCPKRNPRYSQEKAIFIVAQLGRCMACSIYSCFLIPARRSRRFKASKPSYWNSFKASFWMWRLRARIWASSASESFSSEKSWTSGHFGSLGLHFPIFVIGLGVAIFWSFLIAFQVFTKSEKSGTNEFPMAFAKKTSLITW